MAVHLFRLPERRRVQPALIVGAIMTLLSLAAAWGAIALSGTKTGVVLATGAVIGPIAVYWALIAPLIFPFCAYILLVPFDNLLAISAFGTLTKLISLVAAAAIALWLMRTRRAVMPGRALIAWLAFLVWMLASITWAMDPINAAIRIATPAAMIALYTVVSMYPVNRRMLNVVVICAIIGAAAAGAYGTYVFAHGIDIRGGQRLFLANDDTYIDPNHFAAALTVPFCLGIVSFAHARDLWMRIMYGACIAVMGLGMAVAGSRGGMLGLTVAFIYLLIYSRKRIAIAFTALAGVAVGLAFHGNVLQRFNGAVPSGGAGRADIWKVGVVAFKEHWLYGAGLGSFSLAFDQAYLNVSQSYYTHWHRASHNILVGYSVELGIIGVILMLVCWWVQFRSLRTLGSEDPLHPLRRGLEAGTLGLFVSGFFLDIMFTKYLWLAFILFALTRNATRTERVPAPAIVPPTPTPVPAWRFE